MRKDMKSMKELLLLENQICFKIYSAEREITKLYRELLDEIGLTYPQYLAMLVLWEKGTVTVKELGTHLFLDSGTLTPMLKRMEANGLVERRRSVEDERSVCITLTQEGENMREKAECVPTRLLENLDMNPEELMQLDGTLSTILKKLRHQE
ncbi:MarR family transcriptional regulator [Rossellomorea marisflavi]|nr:MarR family transcriptional regulator [Rossellomorea marisflavi]KML34994.1 MarR family transcriptional regulator [Rossellomorea marisflavi]